MHPELEKCLAELEDPDEDVRARAVASLAKIGDPVGFLVLDRVASADSGIQVRFAAKKALRELLEGVRGRFPPMELPADPAGLQGLLESEDPQVRRKCLDLCMAGRVMQAIPLLPKVLETEQDPLVKRSALLFTSLAGRHAIRVLAPFVGDPDAGVRAAAVTSLGIIDDVDIFPHAVRAISDPSQDVQRSAYRICSRVGKANFHRVLERMASSGSAWKRLAAARACSRIRGPHLRQMLERLLEDPEDAVKQAARIALEGLAADASAPKAAAPVSSTRPAAAPTPSRAAVPAASPRPVSTSQAPSASAGKIDELMAWVRETDTARVPEIAEWFEREKDPKVRATLVVAAGKLGGRLATEMLKKCLSDADGRIRANAVEALRGKVQPQTLVGLLNDSDNRCRANAIVALKDHKRVDLIKHLKSMASGEPASRRSAIYAIVELGTAEAARVLEMFNEDPEEDVREKARQAKEILAARKAEAELATPMGVSAVENEPPPEGSGIIQLKNRIADAFGAFRKKMGK